MQQGITLDDIQQALQQAYQKEFLGVVLASGQHDASQWIRLALWPDASDEGFNAHRITVKNREGKLIRLDQLLQVTREEEHPQSYYRINGLNSIYLSIRA